MCQRWLHTDTDGQRLSTFAAADVLMCSLCQWAGQLGGLELVVFQGEKAVAWEELYMHHVVWACFSLSCNTVTDDLQATPSGLATSTCVHHRYAKTLADVSTVLAAPCDAHTSLATQSSADSWSDSYMQREKVRNELAAVSTAQEGGQHGSPDHEGLHPLNGGVIKVQQGQGTPGAVAPLHICCAPCKQIGV